MLLNKDKIIRIEHRRKSNYYTMVDGILYGNNWHDGHRTYCYNNVHDTNGELLLKGSCATHNFTPFKNNGSLFAIGGMDAWKFERSWKSIDDYEEFKIKFKERFKTEYTRDEERFEMFKDRIRKKESLNHSDGLYLFRKTMNGWTQFNKKPVITVQHLGFMSALDYGKSSEFDGQPSIVHFGDKYYIYLRYNVKFRTRYIQYAISDNLMNWSEFNSVEIENYDYDEQNYYTPNFFKYKNYILGMIPYFKGDKACVRLLKSTDGHSFSIQDEIFNSAVSMLDKNSPKNPVVPVNGIVNDNDNIICYMHNNYLGIDKKNPVEIIKYKINKKDFENAFNI